MGSNRGEIGGKGRLCELCRSAAVKFSPETTRGSHHEKCREITGEILLFLFPQETKSKSALNFSRLISRYFSPDSLQLQMPNSMAFFTLQTFVLEKGGKGHQAAKGLLLWIARKRAEKIKWVTPWHWLASQNYRRSCVFYEIILTTPTPHISKKYDPKICHKMRGRMA